MANNLSEKAFCPPHHDSMGVVISPQAYQVSLAPGRLERLGFADEVVTRRTHPDQLVTRYADGLVVTQTTSFDGDNLMVETFELALSEDLAISNLEFKYELRPFTKRAHVLDHNSLASLLYGFVELDDSSVSKSGIASVAIYRRHNAIKAEAQTNGVSLSQHTDVDANARFEITAASLLYGDVVSFEIRTKLVPATAPLMEKEGLGKLMYQTVWSPFRWLAAPIEAAIVWLSSLLGSVGMAIMVFAIMLRIATYPLNAWSRRAQEEFESAQLAMTPMLAEAKVSLSGAEQSQRILDIYAEHKVTPLSGLKGSASLIVQVPLLIALFGVTTEASVFQGASFLWIEDLAYSDRLFDTGYSIPGFGSGVNVLPLLLGLFGWVSTIGRPGGGGQGLWLNLLFTLLFYSFAAALVLYWLTVNILVMLETKFRVHSEHRNNG